MSRHHEIAGAQIGVDEPGDGAAADVWLVWDHGDYYGPDLAATAGSFEQAAEIVAAMLAEVVHHPNYGPGGQRRHSPHEVTIEGVQHGKRY